MDKKKTISNGIRIIFLILTVITFMAWVNNVNISLQWYSDINKANQEESKEERQKLQETIEKMDYKGIFPFLDLFCVDMSTVSTFIPFLFMLLVSIGLTRTIKDKEISEGFPFFASYKKSMIALGLIGSLWGLIMIGFYPGNPDMDGLVMCLHTALFSTLIAVIWVFIIVPPTCNIMQWWHKQVTGNETCENKDLVELMNKFGMAVTSASRALKEHEEQNASTNRQLKETVSFLKEFQERTGVDAYQAIQDACNDVKNAVNSVELTSTAQQNMIQGMKKLVDEQQDIVKALSTDLKDERLKRSQLDKKVKSVQEVLSKLKDLLDITPIFEGGDDG